MAQANVYDRLKELGIELPQAGAPAAAYVMSAQSGKTVYLSGHIAKKDGKPWVGKLGASLSTVNSTPEFTEQHLVTNGASELVADVFGERGKHARSAFGVAQIPLGACVEIEMIAEVE